jgi:hypothetical protein
MSSEAVLLARARRAYEWGRVRAALPRLLFVAPLTVLSLVACGRYAATGAVSVALALILLACLWQGRQAGRGARAGLLAGLGPLWLPLGVPVSAHACTESSCLLFPLACVAGGILGGLVVWRLGARASCGGVCDASCASYALAALSVAALTGSLGCLVAGLAGVLGMILGMAGGALPLAWHALRRA